MSDQGPGEVSPRVVLVTGPSGAGRTTALRVFEDLGYEIIDNLPISMIPRLFTGAAPEHPIALGIDVRNRDFSTHAILDLIDAGEAGWSDRIQVLYLDCRPDVLVNRYSETRRRHPVSPNETPEAGIAKEIDLLQPIRIRADVLIDTSEMSPHDLKSELLAVFEAGEDANLSVSVQSFSYKRGVPRGLDLVFDVRFLRNPHYQLDLRDLSGRDKDVGAFISADEGFQPFFDNLTRLLEPLLPRYAEEGKNYLTIAIGCTGGRHRSVFVAEKLNNWLENKVVPIQLRHRDLDKPGNRD